MKTKVGIREWVYFTIHNCAVSDMTTWIKTRQNWKKLVTIWKTKLTY